MTNTYNTLNPLGSTSAKDLSDNASNFDEGMNSLSPSFYDRFKRRRETWAGMEKMVADFLEAMGFEATHLVYVDGTPLTVLRPTQLIDRSGSVYKVKAPASFPVVLTGTWATDLPNLVDVGDASLRALLASSTGADQVGSTKNDLTVTTVEVRLDEMEDGLDHTSRLLTSSAEIASYFTDGGTLRIANGAHDISAPLVIDYATDTSGGVSTSFTGYVSKRYSIKGESWANSILVSTAADFTLKLLGSYPVTQNFHGNDSIEDLTITNPVRNVPNTTNSGASGILCSVKAYTNIKRVTLKNLKVGLKLDSVLTSKIEDLDTDGCYQGIVTTNSNGVSGPNSMIWSKVKVGLSTSNGIVAEVGSASHFDTITVEGNGMHGTSTCGMVLTIPADQIAPVIKFTNPYFELNKGIADLYIDNLGTQPATIIIEGGVFARAGLEYTDTNIQVHSTGGGQVNVILKGCHFLSVAGYPADPSRPFWKVDSGACHVNADENCTYNETTSLVGQRRQSFVQAATLSSAAGMLAGDQGSLITSKTATGVYRIQSTGSFGLTALDYSVTATPCNSAATGVGTVQRIEFQPISGSEFYLNCFVGTTPTDGPFTFQIAGTRYSV